MSKLRREPKNEEHCLVVTKGNSQITKTIYSRTLKVFIDNKGDCVPWSDVESWITEKLAIDLIASKVNESRKNRK